MDEIVGRRVRITGGPRGEWVVERVLAVRGPALPAVPRVERREGSSEPVADAAWTLHGVRSNERYVERRERDRLVAVQEELGRAASSCAALIPIKKNSEWWQLAQDERRAILEGRSRHIAIGLDYLPAVARRLYHCRDLGEPFDFLTWFEFAEGDRGRFDDLVGRLRETEEWRYVEREVEVRLLRATGAT
jgi:chlorite dismutase